MGQTVRAINDVYVFDIEDGWDDLNTIRFGVCNSLFSRCEGEQTRRRLLCDLYADAFINSGTIPATVPRIFSDVQWFATPCQKYTVGSAWNRAHGQLEYINARTDFTYSDDVAFASEYRHRSRYAWRKVEPYNYFMDAFHTEAELLASPESDRRSTFLAHAFWRINPWISWEYQCRLGWDRILEPGYYEYQVDCHTLLQGSWKLRLSYQSKENDSRFVFFITLKDREPCPRRWPHSELALGNY